MVASNRDTGSEVTTTSNRDTGSEVTAASNPEVESRLNFSLERNPKREVGSLMADKASGLEASMAYFSLCDNLIFSNTRKSFPFPSTFVVGAGNVAISLYPYNLQKPMKTLIRRTKFSSTPVAASNLTSPLHALIFDCDGVILESEHLHRTAYNDAFAHFDVRCSPSQVLNWGLEFYDVLQNRIGGGKPKMRWYFKEHGWPSSSIFETPPTEDSDRAKLIDTIQDWKTERYKEIIRSGMVEPRPGVLRLMDEAKAAGVQLAVCSAATKSSVVLCLENLIGMERFQNLNCFLAGDDVQEKKPDPSIYLTAAKKLGVLGKNCLVVEDSVIGLQAATKAGMSCVVTYTSSTADQDFKEAVAIYPDLSNVRLGNLQEVLQKAVPAN